jgi:uncharacterized protein involved in type VI secretion and phage assembly
MRESHGTYGGRPGDRFYGMVLAKVVRNDDPQGLGRVLLSYTLLDKSSHGTNWVRIATPNKGIAFLPEPGDEVLVMFAGGQVNAPYVIGCLWNGEHKPPVQNKEGDKNNLRVIQSRSGHTFTFDDTEDKDKNEKKGKLTIQSQGGHTLILDDTKDKGKLTIQARSGQTIILDDTKDNETLTIRDSTKKNSVVINSKDNTITVTSEGTLVMKAKKDISIESADGDVTLKAAKGKVSITGKAGVKLNDTALEVK